MGDQPKTELVVYGELPIAPDCKVKTLENVLGEFDDSDPRNIVNLLPSLFVAYIRNIPERILEMGERELQTEVFGADHNGNPNQPSEILSRVRINLWEEYERAQRLQTTMSLAKITQGACNRLNLRKLVETPLKLAWILTQPTQYDTIVTDIHNLSLNRMREALMLSPIKPDGTVDSKFLEVQYKIFMSVDQRKKGAVIQRIDQRTLSLHGTANEADKQAVEAAMSMDQIQTRIKVLQAKAERLANPVNKELETDTIDVNEIQKEPSST